MSQEARRPEPSSPPRKQTWQEAEAAMLALVPPVTEKAEGASEEAANASASSDVLYSPPGRGTAVFVALCALYQVRRAMPLADVTPWDFEALFARGYGAVALLVLFPSLLSLWGIAWSDLKRQSQGSTWLMLQAVVWALLAVVSLFKGEFLAALLMPWHVALVCSLQMTTLERPLEAPVPPRAQRPPPTVRPATHEDQEAIAGLQEAAFARRPATFEPSQEGEEDGQHPVLVAEEDGRVVACASTRAYSPRECHAGVADFGLFVAKEAQGRGVDALLLQALLKAAEERGLHKLTTQVLADRAHTRELFERLGFTVVGTHAKHARVEGAWHDVVVVEKLLR